jgi:hypothetical protein
VNESASLDRVAQKATKTNRCQARACATVGSLRFIMDKAENQRLSYFLCDEHFLLLRESDKRYIARTEGTKVSE